MEIQNLEQMIGPKLNSGKKIIRIENSVSEQQGNGSVMIKLKVRIQNEDGKEELLHLVAKRIPDSEYIRELFNIQKTFKREVQFYDVILPILQKFQKEEGVVILNNFAKFYGARYNLSETSTVVDDDAIILLEDISVRGFKNGNCKIGFDLETAEAVLEDLAKFHGTVIALKIKKPEIFQEKVKPLCSAENFTEDKVATMFLNVVKELIQSFPEYKNFADKVPNFYDKETPTTGREPFGTIVHTDLWVNNIMNRIGMSGKVENIFVDFQIYCYRSSAADLFFFLWTCVQQNVLETELDHLMKHFYEHLINRVNSFGLDTSTFTYEKFEDDMRLEADYEFSHSLLFINWLKFLKDHEGITPENFRFGVNDLTPEFKHFIHFMVAECLKRRWLY